MPGLGDVMDCTELVVDSVTGHACEHTDGGGGLLKFSATMVGVWPATVAEPSWKNRVEAAIKYGLSMIITIQIMVTDEQAQLSNNTI